VIYSFVVLTLPPPVVLVLPSHLHRSRVVCLSKPRFRRPPSPLPPDYRHLGHFNSPREILRTRKARSSLGRPRFPLVCALLPASARSPRRGHRPLLHFPDRQCGRPYTSSSPCHPAHPRRCGRRRAPTPSVAVAMIWVRRRYPRVVGRRGGPARRNTAHIVLSFLFLWFFCRSSSPRRIVYTPPHM
jgi:hypothetical protein